MDTVQARGRPVPSKTPVPVVVEYLTTHGELVHATGDDPASGPYWLPMTGQNPADPDTWEAPVRLTSARFRHLLNQHFPDILPVKAKCKDYVEAASAHAYAGRKVPTVGWSAKEGRGQDTTIRVAISPAIVIAISAAVVRPEPNGRTGLYRIPDEFDALRWAGLVQGLANVDNPCALRAARAAVVDHLPPPTADTPLTQDEQAALVLAWWAGLLAEPVCRGRPLLTMLGEPGSGKTLTAYLMGILYYGDRFEVGGGVGGSRQIKDLVAGMVHSPLAVADDLTNVKREAVDTLCRLATGSAVKLATMHETLHLSSFKARAAAILTSARPGWALRDDMLSRILPVRFDKPARSPMTDNNRVDRVLTHREAAWGELILATQAALQAPARATYYTRFQDWEAVVQAVAEEGGWFPVLVQAMRKLPVQRVSVATSASLEVAALYAIAKQFEDEPRDWTVADLYDLVSEKMGAMLSDDQRFRPSGRMRIQDFVRFLHRVETEGSAAVSLHSRGEQRGQQVWTLRPRA